MFKISLKIVPAKHSRVIFHSLSTKQQADLYTDQWASSSMETIPKNCALHPLQCANLLQSSYWQLAIFDMLYEHYGCEFYIGLLSLSYLVVYTQNYNHTIKVSTFLYVKFCHHVEFTSCLHDKFKTLYYNLTLVYIAKD